MENANAQENEARYPRMSSHRFDYHTWLVALMLSLFVATACTAANAGDHLTSEEREWLANHPVIRLAYETGYPPFTFVDAQGQIRGLSVDYIRLLERKLGIQFEVVAPDDLNVNLNKARSGKVDVLTSLMKTPERSEYLRFTKPYVAVPSVIIVNKGYTGPVTLDRMQGIRIAVCTDYAVTTYVKKKYPFLNLVPVSNELISLRMLSWEKWTPRWWTWPVRLISSRPRGSATCVSPAIPVLPTTSAWRRGATGRSST
jgi:ABC-type amino acid transport substrate-binding protein